MVSRGEGARAQRRIRRLAVALVALGAWLGLTVIASVLTLGATAGAADMAAARLDEMLAVLALVAAWLLLSWLALSVVISALASTPRAVGGVLARLEATVTPALVRRGVAALVGGAVLAGPVLALPAASAAPAPPTRTLAAAVRDPGARPVVVIGGESSVVFDRPLVTLAAQPGAHDGPTGAPAAPVEVRRGDTLWDIAARHLGPDATPAQIAAEWPRWHAANRAVIGSDPGLIRPGQVLTPPTP